MRRVHEAYLKQRRIVYAHTDYTTFRVIPGVEHPEWLDAFVATGGVDLYETWSPPTPDLIEDVRALAVVNRTSFTEKVARLRQRLTESQPLD